MKKFVIIFASVITLLLFSEFTSKKSEIIDMINFELHTDSIKSKEAVEHIIKFGKNFQSQYIENKTLFIELRNYTCTFELSKNPSIGFQRAKKIIDIFEKECSIPRSKIHYIDIPSRNENNATNNVCETMLEQKNVGIKMEVHRCD